MVPDTEKGLYPVFFYIDRKEMRIMMKVREVFHGCA